MAEALEQVRQCLGTRPLGQFVCENQQRDPLTLCRGDPRTRSTGGHGYSSYSGLPSLIADYAVNQTWEGDNTVMSLQTAQYLIKSLSQVMRVTVYYFYLFIYSVLFIL